MTTLTVTEMGTQVDRNLRQVPLLDDVLLGSAVRSLQSDSSLGKA